MIISRAEIESAVAVYRASLRRVQRSGVAHGLARAGHRAAVLSPAPGGRAQAPHRGRQLLGAGRGNRGTDAAAPRRGEYRLSLIVAAMPAKPSWQGAVR